MNKGFTLIELLIALVILALISVMAFRGLDSVLKAKKQVDSENRKWRDISLLFSRLDHDLSNLAHRPVIDASGALQPEFIGKENYSDSFDANLLFTRLGAEGNPPERVGYRFNQGRVEEIIWAHLDQAPGTQPAVYTLLDHVADLRFRYLAINDNWATIWPLPNQPRPKAVEATLTLLSGEKIVRIFSLL
ncbi:MAG: type II secretion system minor pseudopilin GspJ [Burkholderiales bacterium]|nr:type II secretion system minor pseudopilin GspJ [Burkholderiales bacterium]